LLYIISIVKCEPVKAVKGDSETILNAEMIEVLEKRLLLS